MDILLPHQIEDGVYLVHKPKGITSFDLVYKVRKLTGEKKVGHAGTLDPLAHGLMIIGIGPGTKKMNHYLKLPKTYIANIRIGISTDTGDAEGAVLESKKIIISDLKESFIDDALLKLTGTHTFQAPLYSALKVGGKPLYWYARNNQTPPFIPEKEMTLHTYTILDSYRSGPHFLLSVRIEVASGTYIRTLAEELGKKLGYPASLASLYRVSIDHYLDQNAYKFLEEDL